MIYFDEGGNSGGNLLDEVQPFFVLASHDYTKAETDLLLRELISVGDAKELHFKSIKKYPKYKKPLINLFNNELIDQGRIYYYMADKKFMITIQMVDRLIEPVYYEMGYDLYKFGQNIATANLLHALGTSVWKEKYDHICALFVKWVRSSRDEDCKAYYDAVEKLMGVTRKDYTDILELILLSRHQLDTIVRSFGKYTLDANLSCFVDHCNFWAKKYSRPFDVICDDSKQLEYWRDMIDFLTKSLPATEVGFGSRKHKYPLLINSLKTESSEQSREIQLGDLIASTLNYFLIQMQNNPADDLYLKIRQTRLIHHVTGNRMWPTAEVTPEQLDMTDPNGINPLDFLAEAALKNPEKYKSARDTK